MFWTGGSFWTAARNRCFQRSFFELRVHSSRSLCKREIETAIPRRTQNGSLPRVRVADRHVEHQVFGQVLHEVRALEKEQGEAGVDGVIGVLITQIRDRVPASVRRLIRQENGYAPAVPVLVADGGQVVEHGDALEGPEEIEVNHRRPGAGRRRRTGCEPQSTEARLEA